MQCEVLALAVLLLLLLLLLLLSIHRHVRIVVFVGLFKVRVCINVLREYVVPYIYIECETLKQYLFYSYVRFN